MSPGRTAAALTLVATWILVAAGVRAATPPGDVTTSGRSYWAYVCSESEDEVTLVRLSAGRLEKVRVIPVGTFPSETEGPHGIAVDPSGESWYVSLAHGFPFGSVHKFATGTDTWLGEVTVGMFPATVAVSPATGLLYVANFDLHGDLVPSSVSVVETASLVEVARIETGIMPHGARLDAAGDRLYSVNMMQDELVEIDALRFAVSRRLELGDQDASAGPPTVQPTWVSPPTRDGRVYVAGNLDDTLYEVELGPWRVARRFRGGAGPYNLAVADGRRLLAVTYKKAAAIGFWDLDEGVELARVATTRRIPHGVAITADGVYTLVTLEGIGSEPGTVEAYDNRTLERVATLDVGKQAGGIALWDGPAAH